MDIKKSDLRVDLVLQVGEAHMISSAGISHGSQQEHWRCRCGESFTGMGSIARGRRHTAEQIVAALVALAVI